MTTASPAPADPPTIDYARLEAERSKLIEENPLFQVGEAEIRGNTYRVFKNAPPSLTGLFMHGASHGDKDFLVYEDTRITFAQSWALTCRFASALQKEVGIKQGDRVAIAMRNYPEWCISYMAIVALGAVVVPLNSWWKEDELRYGLEDCQAKTVIVDAKRLSYLLTMKEDLGLTLILAREDGEGADYRYETLLEGHPDVAVPMAAIQPDDDFCIIYTSGSTGRPKGVILTHRGCISTLLSWALFAAALKEARNGVSMFGDDPGILLGIPLFHVTGSHSIFLLSLVVGRKIVMAYRWDPDQAIDLINEEQVTNFVGVPSQSYEMAQKVGARSVPSLVDIGSGGAKRPPEHVRLLTDTFPAARPSSGYGLSETNAVGCVISLDDYQAHPDSTGKVVPPVTDLKIVSDDDALTDLPVGEVGEVWIRSPANFRGYLNMPEATADVLRPDGWFRTGDLGRLDEDGFVYIVDRKKDLIIRGGENISCLDVENQAYEHAGVAQAAAFSVPDETLGERVGLVVYPKEGESLDAEELRTFMQSHMANFKVPERIWISPSPLPRLGTEKFDKITVRMIALQHPPTFSVN
ncbi:MAG: class I adenylate-forming enzyme family protein [Pseudomonadota bacterium]